jgi:hypothetical protein
MEVERKKKLFFCSCLPPSASSSREDEERNSPSLLDFNSPFVMSFFLLYHGYLFFSLYWKLFYYILLLLMLLLLLSVSFFLPHSVVVFSSTNVSRHFYFILTIFFAVFLSFFRIGKEPRENSNVERWISKHLVYIYLWNMNVQENIQNKNLYCFGLKVIFCTIFYVCSKQTTRINGNSSSRSSIGNKNWIGMERICLYRRCVYMLKGSKFFRHFWSFFSPSSLSK